MTYKEICDFIENKMRMSHIYQPLLIKTLVESEGISTTRKIALEFLRYDESQIQYYERVVKSMPVKVLHFLDNLSLYLYQRALKPAKTHTYPLLGYGWRIFYHQNKRGTHPSYIKNVFCLENGLNYTVT